MIRIYLSPRYFVEPKRTRNILAQFVHYPEGFEEMVDVSKEVGLCVVDASDVTHAAIIADGRATPLSPLYADRSVFHTGLKTEFRDIGGPSVAAGRNKLEELGLDTSKIADTDTLQSVVGEVARLIFVRQAARGGRTIAKPKPGTVRMAGERF